MALQHVTVKSYRHANVGQQKGINSDPIRHVYILSLKVWNAPQRQTRAMTEGNETVFKQPPLLLFPGEFFFFSA